MKEDFVDYGLAVKLKEKGYPQKSFGKYSMAGACYFNDGRFYEDGCIANVEDCCSAPTIPQVLKWLREEKNLHIEIVSAAYGYIYIVSDTPNKGGTDRVSSQYRGSNDGGAWDDYNECVLDAIEYVIDNLI